MILSSIAAKLTHGAKGDFKGQHYEARIRFFIRTLSLEPVGSFFWPYRLR